MNQSLNKILSVLATTTHIPEFSSHVACGTRRDLFWSLFMNIPTATLTSVYTESAAATDVQAGAQKSLSCNT